MFKALRAASTLHLNTILYRVFVSTHPFSDYFKGMEKLNAVRKIFREQTEVVLRDLQVDFTWIGGYMGVNGSNGHLIVNTRYLHYGDRVDIYLDLIHELVHIKQFSEGKDLFDRKYSYVERPTEVEAYRYAVEEAKRLGLSDRRICNYLRTEWMNDEDFMQLARTLNINCPNQNQTQR
jgi:hypothetical protein